MKYSPADVVAALLQTTDIGTDPSLDKQWPIFAGPMPDAPDALIVVTNNPSPTQGRIQRTGETISNPGIMVRVRSADAGTSQDKMQEIATFFDTVLRAKSVVQEKAYKVQAIHQQTSPVDAGSDPSNRNVFTLNCITTIKEVTR